MAATKPTIVQYNKVYEGLRQSSKQNYDLLRTWILDQTGSGGTVEDITYADFLTLLLGGTLVPGTWYGINDFRSRQEIPSTVDINTGPVEVLFVLATAVDAIHQFALSGSFPQDILMYDPRDLDFGADMGRITYRFDTEFNLEAWFDFRTFVYRRWEDGAGEPVVITDNGNPFVDLPAFGTDCVNCSIGPFFAGTLRVQSNNQMGLECNDIHIEGSIGNSIVSECSNINLRPNSGLNTIFDNCINLDIGEGTLFTTIDAGQSNITVGRTCQSLHFAGGCNGIDVGDSTTGCQFEGTLFASIGSACNALFFLRLPSANTIEGINIGNDTGSVTLDATGGNISEVSIGPGGGACVITAPAQRIAMQAGTIGHDVAQLSTGSRADDPNRSIIYTEWDFALQGGAQGNFDLDLLPDNAIIVNGAFRVITALTSGGLSEIAIGIEVDAVDGLLAPTVFSDAIFNGDLQPVIAPIPIQGTTAQNRALQMAVSVADLTGGKIAFWFECLSN